MFTQGMVASSRQSETSTTMKHSPLTRSQTPRVKYFCRFFFVFSPCSKSYDLLPFIRAKRKSDVLKDG